jgi:type II secretory pathway pseudopilin PulG
MRQRGYTLVALVVALVVMNIAVGAAVRLWSDIGQREKEHELIFRGLQYAEAIRVFQQRFGRQPTSLEELYEVKPRCIRQLWTDPLSESGRWEPILAGRGGRSVAQSGAPSGARSGAQSRRRATPGSGSPRSTSGEEDDSRTSAIPGLAGSEREAPKGPIEGVRPTAEGTAKRIFLGQGNYSAWEFRAQMLSGPSVSASGIPKYPRLDPDAIGRGFPPEISITGLRPAAPTPEDTERSRRGGFGEDENDEEDGE